MTVGIVDTTVIIHILRKRIDAKAWLDSQPVQLSVTTVTWLEVMYGAAGKSGQSASRNLLERFEMLYPTQADWDWTIDKMITFRFSHGISILDCLIASVCHRLEVPLLH